jgi:carbon monoxide dehydrogenase subunit G
MNAMTVSRHVEAPPDRVWAVLTDLEHSPEVISAIRSVEIHTGPGFDVGTRWTETRTMMGRTASETMEVTAVDPGRSYVVEADSGGTHYRSEFRIAPDGGGTALAMTFGGQPSGLGGKLAAATFGRLFAGATRKALIADLDDIARASEHGSGRS